MAHFENFNLSFRNWNFLKLILWKTVYKSVLFWKNRYIRSSNNRNVCIAVCKVACLFILIYLVCLQCQSSVFCHQYPPAQPWLLPKRKTILMNPPNRKRFQSIGNGWKMKSNTSLVITRMTNTLSKPTMEITRNQWSRMKWMEILLHKYGSMVLSHLWSSLHSCLPRVPMVNCARRTQPMNWLDTSPWIAKWLAQALAGQIRF